MPIKSPLGQFAGLVHDSQPERRQAIIPETIRLPDGREFLVRDLMRPRERALVYNLRSKNPQLPRNRPTMVKYTLDDRIWMADATVDEIRQRWQVTDSYARILKNQGHNIKSRFSR